MQCKVMQTHIFIILFFFDPPSGTTTLMLFAYIKGGLASIQLTEKQIFLKFIPF